MAVRSEYIKKLMNSANSLDKQFEGVIKESMKNIIGENTKKEIRQLLKEADDEDSYEEEDVVDDIADANVEGDKEESSEDKNADLWDDLEKCKTADGEYDCTGMDNDKLMDVVDSMGSEDGIRIVSNGDGTATLEVDGDLIDGNKEFVIDLDDLEDEGEIELSAETDDDTDIDDSDFEDNDTDIILDVDDEDNDDELEESYIIEVENSGNTGYTDNYQKKTAMTTPNNNETAPNEVNDWDKGVPHGTEKPWTHKGDTQPYKENVKESLDMDECGTVVENEKEDELEEGLHTTGQNNALTRGTGITKPNSNLSHKYAREGAPGADSPTSDSGRGTGDGYKEASNESKIRKRMKMLYNENKQMKAIIPELQKRVEESIVINASMGYIVKLLNENTTTVDEKKQISERFGKVNTLEECKNLYEQISSELKNSEKSNGLSSLDKQLSEGKQRLIETTMYKSEKVNDTLDFMKRLDAIK